jgi:N-acetylmuramoyl-L-alanine amidase
MNGLQRKVMRRIDYIVLHCTATPQTTTIESIQNYWKNKLGWKSPGYHFIIKPDGSVVNLLPIDHPSNGVAGHNAHSIHISYIGGVDIKGRAVDNRTDLQKKSQVDLIKNFLDVFPDAEVLGHRDFLVKGSPKWKECPSFDVRDWLKTVDLSSSRRPKGNA